MDGARATQEDREGKRAKKMAIVAIRLLEYLVIAGASLFAGDLAFRAWNRGRMGQVWMAGAILIAGFAAFLTLLVAAA